MGSVGSDVSRLSVVFFSFRAFSCGCFRPMAPENLYGVGKNVLTPACKRAKSVDLGF